MTDLDCSLAGKNIEFLDRFVGGDEYRWMMLPDQTTRVPADRVWRAISPLLAVHSISMGKKAAEMGIETEGFVGHIDYVLLNYVKHRQMVLSVCFERDEDAMLWKMRQPGKTDFPAPN